MRNNPCIIEVKIPFDLYILIYEYRIYLHKEISDEKDKDISSGTLSRYGRIYH